MRDLTSQQARQLLDAEQIFSAYRAVEQELKLRFSGSMSWKAVKGRDYLYRKVGGDWVSLGPKSGHTQQVYDRFRDGRRDLKDRKRSLDAQIRSMAPINRALGLGRVPTVSAQIIRKLQRLGFLGNGLKIVGTHAVYAYERMGGVHFGYDAVTTQDVDLLYDARRALKLSGSDVAKGGLVGILQSLDATFAPLHRDSFRAVNDQGFMVDLITPSTKNASTRKFSAALSSNADDLIAVEIEGLAWLENSPSVSQIALDERGYPLTIVAPDPRTFVCHKLWVGQRDDRDPVKKRRDIAQAQEVAEMLATRLPHLSFEDTALSAIPADLLRAGSALAARRAAAQTETSLEWDQ